jgi:hypothetical protein
MVCEVREALNPEAQAGTGIDFLLLALQGIDTEGRFRVSFTVCQGVPRKRRSIGKAGKESALPNSLNCLQSLLVRVSLVNDFRPEGACGRGSTKSEAVISFR